MIRREARQDSAGGALTAKQKRILTAGGFEFGPEADTAGKRARKELAAQRAAPRPEPGTTAVARGLGVSMAQVRRLAAARRLLSVRVDRRLRFPAVQFEPDGPPLPGLPEVLAAHGQWPTEQVVAFSVTPQPEPADRGRPRTPAAWRAAGSDPGQVAALAGPGWT